MIIFIRIALVCIGFAVACSPSVPEPKRIAASEIAGLIKEREGKKAVLVNVWATWCAPCVAEFPHIVKAAAAHSEEVDVLFISADFPEDSQKVTAFLKEQGVFYQTYLKDDADEVFINALDERWTGAIPVTVIFNKKGEKSNFWEGEATFETFEKALLSAIN